MSRAIGSLTEILPSKKMWKREGPGLPTSQQKMWKREGPGLPTSQSDPSMADGGLRKRLAASFSTRSEVNGDGNSSSWTTYFRSKSFASADNSNSVIKQGWDWVLGFFVTTKKTLSRKMSATVRDRDGLLGGKHVASGSFMHAFYKIKAKIRRLMNNEQAIHSDNSTFRYDALSYAQNFDDGRKYGESQPFINGKRSY